jgi:anti-sigma regulatory factor (Ser/Thr protein kinase)
VIEQRTTVPADAAQLPALVQFLQSFWTAQKLPPAQALTFELALEEVFLNVVLHGAPFGPLPRIEVTLALLGHGLTMTVEDTGPHFDPTALPSPDVTASAASRPVGGLGVFLVRQMMDAVSYERVGERNRLRMTKYLPG